MRFPLHQTAVYWAPTGTADAKGRPILGTPREVRCRWEDRVSETIAPNGDKVVSGATVYTDCETRVGGMLMLGRLSQTTGFQADVRAQQQVREIINEGAAPSISARQTLYTARLR